MQGGFGCTVITIREEETVVTGTRHFVFNLL